MIPETIPHSPRPKHTRLRQPYNRQGLKEELSLIVDNYFSNYQEEHPLLFCSDLDVCYYATADCLYHKKRCYCA